jgi:hypothetical protein
MLLAGNDTWQCTTTRLAGSAKAPVALRTLPNKHHRQDLPHGQRCCQPTSVCAAHVHKCTSSYAAAAAQHACPCGCVVMLGIFFAFFRFLFVHAVAHAPDKTGVRETGERAHLNPGNPTRQYLPQARHWRHDAHRTSWPATLRRATIMHVQPTG